ncbi:MAG TPA: tRNA (cytidine(34)-2'-O)-methyltransferase [Candidatus Aminicenantes bacterium]|nr:tRNA (cytidine(34)-2'-O)-methyltransferase [Candidatus Aminicenantes bacterium]
MNPDAGTALPDLPPPPEDDGGLAVVLVAPEIPQNTGNIARTCAALGVPLHLVGPLGFRLDDRHLRRAGIDYWPAVTVYGHHRWEDFRSWNGDRPLALFSARGTRRYDEVPLDPLPRLVFGGESAGLPEAICREYANRLYRLPMRAEIRSLNLASTATAVLYDVLRRLGFPGV